MRRGNGRGGRRTPEPADEQKLSMELAGLEPATSWVRSRRSGCDSGGQKRRISGTFAETLTARPLGRSPAQLAYRRGSHVLAKTRIDRTSRSIAPEPNEPAFAE